MSVTESARARPEPSLFRNRDFVRFWLGQAVSEFGTAVSTFALPLIALELTHSAAKAGIFTATQKAPFVVAGLYAGAIADRHDRKRIMLSANAVQAAALAYLALAAAFWGLSFPQLLLGGLVAGTGFVFFDVADNASFVRIAGREQLPKASAVLEGTVQAAELCGPAAGGLLLGVGSAVARGAAAACAFDCTTYIFSAAMILRIRRALQGPAAGVSDAPRRIGDGLRFLIEDIELRRLAIGNFVNLLLLSPIGLALIVSARSRFGSGTFQTGLIFTLGGLAGIGGAAITPWLRRHLSTYVTMAVASTAWSVGCIVIVVANSAVVLACAWGLIASAMPVYFSTLYAHRVALIPDELQGRVNAAYRLLSNAAVPVGALAGGLLISAIGVRTAVACLALGFAGAALATIPELIRMRGR